MTGAGVDIAEFARVAAALRRGGRRFLDRVYTGRETASFPSRGTRYFTLNFSFKEAVWKALPPAIQKRAYFRDIEIVWTGRNPEILLFGTPLAAECDCYCT